MPASRRGDADASAIPELDTIKSAITQNCPNRSKKKKTPFGKDAS
jgi:hypothetical protein